MALWGYTEDRIMNANAFGTPTPRNDAAAQLGGWMTLLLVFWWLVIPGGLIALVALGLGRVFGR